jgi:uncharacterized protein
MQFVEYRDPRAFQEKVEPWLMVRETENSGLITQLPILFLPPPRGARVFVIEEHESVALVAALFADGRLIITWAQRHVLFRLAQGLREAGCTVSAVYGPAHLSWPLAEIWARMTGQRFAFGPEERVYQLGRLRYAPPATGHLEMAGAEHRALAGPWLREFARETGFIDNLARVERILFDQHQLYLWMAPHPVAMAAWVSPTPHGAGINCVYAPPEYRGHGFGKAVVAALAQRMLDSGLEFCVIHADAHDLRTNALYQALGARTLCELMRCPILPAS